jgi:glycosyltransferase involved in cell wall biosynthesis
VIYFIAAVYNEQDELDDLFAHVSYLVDGYAICDDGSTDRTQEILRYYNDYGPMGDFRYKVIDHTGLPETVKNEAKNLVPDNAWCLMLDADERLTPTTIKSISDWFDAGEDQKYDYVYFNQLELIDSQHVRTFQKAKLFKKEAIHFPLNNIHADDVFDGNGTFYNDWTVIHRKTTVKQIKREQEYLDTYKRLLDEGHIDEGRYNWLRNLHHYIK